MHKAILFLAILIGCFGCSRTPTAQEAGVEIVEQLNAAEFEKSWENVAPTSKEAVARQLQRNLSTPAGRRLIMEWLGVEEGRLSSISPKDYYVLIMEKGHAPKAPPVVIKSISEGSDRAVIHWQKGDHVSESILVKESGRWYFLLDEVDGE